MRGQYSPRYGGYVHIQFLNFGRIEEEDGAK